MNHGSYKRSKYRTNANNIESAIGELNQILASGGNYLAALDLIEEFSERAPQLSVPLLAQAYNILQQLPNKECRYSLYQSRYYNFPVKPGDKVLDIGSGHLPFPMATHLADLAIEDDNFGRAGIPFKHIDGKPVFNCSVENMPFEDKFFDFVYCSHVLEHVDCPFTACKELMRVAKRGYLETPTRAKDLFMNTGKISNHHWMVEYFNNRLVFTEYAQEQLEGLACDILMSMHCNPETEREKAFSALLLLKSDQVNTMLMWEEGFDVELRRIGQDPEFMIFGEKVAENLVCSDALAGAVQLLC